ncbi:hypothetical protein C5167_016787 [Papaver somniferum]|uniref:uncharacterized vacuolar membrane protein YML018C-like n=1 Tax=Papaver somniferum TaxID=3469 RepID=UPI000E6FA007|nr:uncharacterized vacuolar membrane protein YML018C-like [Papaver somniferum]RZC94093.1 hypothetical protein C5167_016787 [Papaver somniferum]
MVLKKKKLTMSIEASRWVLGLFYLFAVALIWVASNFIVQSVISGGASPFLITYICNSLFTLCIPIFEIYRYFEDSPLKLWFWCSSNEINSHMDKVSDSDEVPLLTNRNGLMLDEQDVDNQLDAKGRLTRIRTAKVSLLLCPFWFLAYLTFNLSLKYTTVTSITILSNTSSLFAFLLSLCFLGEKFTWIKLISILLCMGGSVIVSVGDMESGLNATAIKPLLGDILSVVSASLYASFLCIFRKQIPVDDAESGRVSILQLYGYLGLLNTVIFLPVVALLHFTKLEQLNSLTWSQTGLIVCKGLIDNVLGDYLWAKAVLLTTATVATAGLTIQVPMAAGIDAIRGRAPSLMDYLGALVIMAGFAGINIRESENENGVPIDESYDSLPVSKISARTT